MLSGIQISQQNGLTNALFHKARDDRGTGEKKLLPMVRKVLFENAAPKNMPIGFLEENYINLNVTAAKAIGLTIPDTIVKEADSVY